MSHRLLILTALALGAAGCGRGDAAATTPTAAPPATLAIRADTLTTLVPVAGSVVARRRAELATRLTARVGRVPVEAGTAVRAGQLLVELGTEDVAAARARAAAGRSAAQAARDEAARQADRMDTLLAHDAVAQVQRDGAHLALAQAEAQLATADAALRDAATAESYAALTAPFEGVVASRSVDPGDLAVPGAPLVVVEDRGPRDGLFAVPADLAARLQPRDTLQVADLDGRSVAAPIRVVARSADPATRTVEVRVIVPPDWPTGVALTGLVPAGVHTGVAVPASAVVRRGQLTGVRVLSGDQVVMRWVRLGRPVAGPKGTARVEVLSGLEPGDRFVP
ncbi:MAG TPA: efflux RND transporter periplasmic adaptor subunit [Gemmatimonadales bacterium]|nr:efflux RND transporter periplasmic adaptor subunit [Gemmatimonadales bacterium]